MHRGLLWKEMSIFKEKVSARKGIVRLVLLKSNVAPIGGSSPTMLKCRKQRRKLKPF